MIGRIDQQLRVTRLMLEYYDLDKIQPAKLRKYMLSYLQIMMTISSVLAIRSGTAENMEKRDRLWSDLKEQDPKLYQKLRYSLLGIAMTRKNKLGNKTAELGYTIAQRIYGFN